MTGTLTKLRQLRNEMYKTRHVKFADRLQGLIDEVEKDREEMGAVISIVSDGLGYDDAMKITFGGSTNDIDDLHDAAADLFTEKFVGDRRFIPLNLDDRDLDND